MNFYEFITEFHVKQDASPTYRLGQHFIITFCNNECDPLFNGLWDMPYKPALERITQIIDTYQWDYKDLPVKTKND